MAREAKPCPFYGMSCEYVPMAEKADAAAARIKQLEAALAVRPIKPRHHPEKLRRMTGEDGYHKGWQEALTALGNARAALGEK